MFLGHNRDCLKKGPELLSRWGALGSGCFPDEKGFTLGVWLTGARYSERGGWAEDVHDLEQHPGMLAGARGGEGSARYPARTCHGSAAEIRALHVASQTQTEPLLVHGIF